MVELALTQGYFEASPDAVVVTDAEGLIVLVNAQAEALFGYPRAALIGRSVDTLVPGRFAGGHAKLRQGYVAEPRNRPMGTGQTLFARRKDGSEVPVDISLSPFTAAGKSLVICSLRDASARVKVEAELRQALERSESAAAELRTFVESAPDGIVVADRDGRIVRVNRQTEKLFGYGRDELVGQPVETLIPQQLVAGHGGHLRGYFSAPRVRSMGNGRELLARRKDGSEFPADISLAPLETPEGMRQDLKSIFRVTLGDIEKNLPLDFAVICTYDAIDYRLTVDTVSAGSQPLAEALGLTEGVALEIDSNGLSRAIRGELVHEPDTAAVGLPFSTRLAQAGLHALAIAPLAIESKVLGVLMACRREANSLSSVECEFLRQLSEHVTLAAQHAQLHGALQRAYDDLRQTQRAVMQQERLGALGQMASGIAHDINNAISPASLYIESLLAHEPGLSERGREHLTTIARAIDDVAKTVSGMREFYRQREPQLVLLPVQCNRLIHQVVDLTRPRWSDQPQKRGRVIELRSDLAHELPLVMGIESELREALTNLIFNAVDAMPEGGVMTLRSRMMIWGERAGAHAGALRDRGDRHRRRHGRGHPPPLPRAVFHHQGRAWHRPRPGDGLRGHGTPQRGYRDRQRTGKGHYGAPGVHGPAHDHRRIQAADDLRG